MRTHESWKVDIPWHALLNCPEAGVLGAREERQLLIELADCRTRILASSSTTGNNGWDEPASESSFQQTVRELASRPSALDPMLQSVAKRYQQIRSKLALANVRLVAHIAKRYAGRGIPAGDLMQEGICSLLFAIDRFAIENKTRLATYALWWIRQGIQRAIAAGAYPVRLNPRHLHRLAQLRRTQADDPWPRREHVNPAKTDSRSLGASQTLDRLIAATRPALSLDAPSHCDGMTAVVDFLIPGGNDEPEPKNLDDSVEVLIEKLAPREQLILTLRFGLGGNEQQTLVQVSKVLGVSKERVRQIEARALRKLRALPRHGLATC